jgi:hypothetical protein
MDRHKKCWIQEALIKEIFVLQLKLKLVEHKRHTSQMTRHKH